MQLYTTLIVFLVSLLFVECQNIPSSTSVSVAVLVDNQSADPYTWALEDLQSSGRLESISVKFEYYYANMSRVAGVSKIIEIHDDGITLALGNNLSNELALTGVVGEVYGVAQLSGTASSDLFSDKSRFPYVTRLVSPDSFQAKAIVDLIVYYNTLYPSFGWNKVGVIFSADTYGLGLYNQITKLLPKSITLAISESILPGDTDAQVEFQAIHHSSANVILLLVTASTFTENLILQAKEVGIMSDDYAWIASDSFVNSTPWIDAQGNVNDEIAEALRGFIGTLPYVARSGISYANLLKHTNGVQPSVFDTLDYDCGLLLGLTLNRLAKEGLMTDPILPDVWSYYLRNTSFFGASGYVDIDDKGDRSTHFFVQNFLPELYSWNTVAVWNRTTHLFNFTESIIWNDNTTNVPNLNTRPPFRYWACDKREFLIDPTGNTVVLRAPDGSNPDNIESDYYCDGFVDCDNVSDEAFSCSTNYVALYISFGVVTGFLLVIGLLCIPFTIVFGLMVKHKRVTAASPTFLLIMTISVLIGYSSTFTWYGKANTVACNFQLWLLGLSLISMIAALSAKTFRIWRIFKSPFAKVIITDVELLILWTAIMIPAVIIILLWTVISTPVATMLEHEDKLHYTCNSDGGYIFLGIYVGYLGIVLGFALFLSVVTRNVPSLFNESKLVAISIHHITLLGIVVIPTVLVLDTFEPFAAWIIRTIAILYGFTVTLWLQFLPKVAGIVFVDNCSDVDLHSSSMSWMNQLPGSGDSLKLRMSSSSSSGELDGLNVSSLRSMEVN